MDKDRFHKPRKFKRRPSRRTNEASHPCIIVGSKELKNAIKNRCEELNIKIYNVVNRLGMPWDSIKRNYWQNESPLSTPAVRAEDIIEIANEIGIRVRVSVILDHPNTIEDPEPLKIKKSEYQLQKEKGYVR